MKIDLLKRIVIILSFAIQMNVSVHVKNCLSVEQFNKNFRDRLQGKSMVKLFQTEAKPLGEGSFGEVRSVKWKEGGKISEVAVKKILLTKPKILKDVEKEVGIYSTANESPLVANLKGCFEDFDYRDADYAKKLADDKSPIHSIYLVFEKLYMDFGESNSKDAPINILRRMPPMKRVEIYLKIALAVLSLHQCNIVHSDLKPANFMAADKNLSTIKLIDLGMSNFEKQLQAGLTLTYSGIEYHSKNKLLYKKFDMMGFGMSVGALEIGSEKITSKSEQYWTKNYQNAQKLIQTNIDTVLTGLKKITDFVQPSKNGDSFYKIIDDCLKWNYEERISSETLVSRLQQFLGLPVKIPTNSCKSQDSGIDKPRGNPSKVQKPNIPVPNSSKENQKPAPAKSKADSKNSNSNNVQKAIGDFLDNPKKKTNPPNKKPGPKDHLLRQRQKAITSAVDMAEQANQQKLDEELKMLPNISAYFDTNKEVKMIGKVKLGESPEPSFWDSYKYWIIGGGGISLLAFIAVPLVYFATRK
jgi:serine/threonine protein kinase